MPDHGESMKYRRPSTLLVCVYLALISVPFWFLVARFSLELDDGQLPRPPQENPGAPEALILSLVFGAATFGIAAFTLRKEIRKR